MGRLRSHTVSPFKDRIVYLQGRVSPEDRLHCRADYTPLLVTTLEQPYIPVESRTPGGCFRVGVVPTNVQATLGDGN